MIKYDYIYFHKALLKLQSSDFQRYQFITEKDLLMQKLNNEEIGDYSEIDWRWISDLLYGEESYDGQHYYFYIGDDLEQFITKIFSRDERIRILTYLRDNCTDCLFNGFYEYDSVCDFEKECARLISYNIQQSSLDEYHGRFAEEPIPDLVEIATTTKEKPEHSILETTILAAIPKFPNDRNVISKDILLQVAYDFMDLFHNTVEEYEQSGRDESKKPCMSQQKYADTIYKMIGTRANRFLYFDKNPVYQVYFILGCLWAMPDHRRSWWEENFAKGIGDYLEKTNNFKGCKAKIQEVVNRILGLNQCVLDFGAEDVEQVLNEVTEPKPNISEQPKPMQSQLPQIQCAFVINRAKTEIILHKIAAYLDGKVNPKDVMMPFRAAMNAGVIRRPTYDELKTSFPTQCPKSKASVSFYTKTDNEPYTDEAFLRIVEEFKKLG